MPDTPTQGNGFNPVTDETDSTGGAQGPAAKPNVSVGSFDTANQPSGSTTPVVQPSAGAPPQAAAPSGQPTPQQPHPVSKMFDNILKTISGGPIMVTDPVTGQRREIPQTKGSMARAITAAALAGLFTPNSYRQSAFGGQVVDQGSTMAAAGRAGMDARAQREQKAQQYTDEQQARKLMTLQNNAHQVTLSAAMAHQKGESFDQVIAANDKYLAPVHELEKTLGMDKVWTVPGGMTAAEVLASGHNLSDNNVIATGKKFVNDANGIPQPELTYGILRNDFALKLPQEITDELAKFDQRFENVYKATGGNVVLPINAYVNRVQMGNRLINAENFLSRVNKQVNGDDAKSIDLVAAFKANPSKYEGALEELEHDMAAGTGRDEGTDDHLVNQMRTTPGGTALLGLIGDVNKTDKWAQDSEAERERKYQQELSMGKAAGKYMYQPITGTTAPGITADPNQPPARRTQAQSVLDIIAMQKERVARAENTIRAGDPNEAGRLMAEGDLTLSELKSRGSTPGFITKSVTAANAYAQAHGFAYNAQEADAEFKIAGNEQNVSYFSAANSLIKPNGTIDQLLAAHAALGNTRIPIFNSWKDAIEFQAGDPALSNFMQVAIGVADEYATVMSKGNQPGQELLLTQLNSMSNKLNNNQMAGLAAGMRGTVNAQVTARIGNNRILGTMYGSQIQSLNPQPKPVVVPPIAVFIDPKTHKPYADGVPVHFVNGQTWTLKNGVPMQVQKAPGK